MNTQYIQVKLFASLAKFTPRFENNYPISRGITVKDLIEQLNVPQNEVKIVFINRIKADLNSVLKSGDRVGIFPPVGGG